MNQIFLIVLTVIVLVAVVAIFTVIRVSASKGPSEKFQSLCSEETIGTVTKADAKYVTVSYSADGKDLTVTERIRNLQDIREGSSVTVRFNPDDRLQAFLPENL